MDQIYVHLTNNAVQKYSKNYGKFEEGNIVSVEMLAQELSREFGGTSQKIKQQLTLQIQEQVLHSLEAVKQKLKFSKHTFELVGYDFMLILSPLQQNDNPQSVDNNTNDSNVLFETRLIEVNTNPCLEEPNAILKTYLPRMADDMLRIVLDPLFGTVPIAGISQ